MTAIQLPLTESTDKRQELVPRIDTNLCRISRFNTRKTRTPEQVQQLAERIARNGFELTRALWGYIAPDGVYEIFAGGTRLEAASMVGVDVAVVVHAGYTWEEISNLSDRDNENDEYHTPVRPMDVWAEYARLRDDEGWTQKHIAQAKDVNESDVSARLKYHELPKGIKESVLYDNSTTGLTERHLKEVFSKIRPVEFLTSWPEVDEWRIELLQWAADKGKSSRQLATEWDKRKKSVERANDLLAKLPAGEHTEYIYNDIGDIEHHPIDWCAEFVGLLMLADVKSAADVDMRYSSIVTLMKRSAEIKDVFDQKTTAAEQEAHREAELIEFVQGRWHRGDCAEMMTELENNSVRLLLTDPPYGVDFQSNRRVASGKEDKLQNDGSLEIALDSFDAMLDALSPKLQEEAHLLVFTNWQVEYEFMQALRTHGYTVRGSLVWVKENHTSGDLTGAFAPKHERIIHATKGRPEVSPRVDDVQEFARGTITDHPTEKPTALLQQLIECTTQSGDLVVDPYGGVASTLVAAKQLQRDFWGCEIDAQWWQQGFERVKNVAA